MKKVFLLFFLFSSTAAFSQSFFKNSTPLITWNSGENKPQNSKLKNGGLLNVKFDGMLVNVRVIFDSTGYTVNTFEETDDWKKLQITEYDFDKNGKNELIIAYGDKEQALLKVLVYKITKSSALEIGSFDGQFDCYFEKNKINLPYGSQGLFTEYTLTKGKFVQTN